MLPTAGYFRTVLCPFYEENRTCQRPFCHFKHDQNKFAEVKNLKKVDAAPKERNAFSYQPTPLSLLGQSVSSAPTYSPTPIAKPKAEPAEKHTSKHDVVTSILESAKEETKVDSHRSRRKDDEKKRHKSSSKKESRRSSKDSGRKSSSSEKEKSHKSHKSHKRDSKDSSSDEKRKKSSKRSSSESNEDKKASSKKSRQDKPAEDVPDSVLSFLAEMDKIDSKLGQTKKPAASSSPPKKFVKESSSFLSEINQPDKVIAAQIKAVARQESVEINPRKAKTRISAVNPSEIGLSSAAIARKRQVNNPVQAMLNRFQKAKVESQTKDLEDQLCALTGESPTPSTSKVIEPLEGLRKGKVQRKAHTINNVAVLRRPTIDTDSVLGKVPNNVRQKYLDVITDECLKMFPNNNAAAYERAIREEKICCDKSKNRSIYLSLVVSCIKKLRTAVKEAGISGSLKQSKTVTPNMLTTHLQILAGKAGTIGTWSIESSVKNVPDMTSERFYLVMKRYALTEEQMEEHGYPTPSNLTKAFDEAKFDQETRSCDRCNKAFKVDEDGLQVVKEECVYHWARLRRNRGNKATGYTNIYPCCKGDASSDGCSVNAFHITNDVDPRGFVKTLNSDDKSKERVYALDCEMCYTTRGIELTRVTVIDQDGNSSYESFVKPDNKILDYNTRFSGVTEKDLKDVTTTIRDVQAVLLSMFSSDSILCGHSLESDLKALKLVHANVVDTSVVFPHKLGLPFKRALRTLTSEFLQRIIQEDVGGHDSKEDALAALDLMKYKVKEDLKRL